jgi:G:T-mismatch repair DNA endonuclease (very short patch repair protein)
MSIADVARQLKISKSTVYNYLVKFGIKTRSKKEAQLKHLKGASHQRAGTKHSQDSKNKISQSSKEFWDSERGVDQKRKLADLRKKEWNKLSVAKRRAKIAEMNSAEKPESGVLSKFGAKFSDYLRNYESNVDACIHLTSKHISDIVLEDRKTVIEFVIPGSIYGDEAARKLSKVYQRLTDKLNEIGYRVIIVEDCSNTISDARCDRLYDRILKFFDSKEKNITIES